MGINKNWKKRENSKKNELNSLFYFLLYVMNTLAEQLKNYQSQVHLLKIDLSDVVQYVVCFQALERPCRGFSKKNKLSY